MSVNKLFSQYLLGGVVFPNRVLISPMSQYSAIDGFVQDWHHQHINRMVAGYPGCVMVEVAAVKRDGRGTIGDLGIWSDEHIPGLKKLAEIIQSHNAIPAIQIGHAGRKASMSCPWEGNQPLALNSSFATSAWQTMSVSPEPVKEGWPISKQLDETELADIVQSFQEAALRAIKAGFQFVEIHAAHGYLLHSFLSPITNLRDDQFGGSLENRMRFPLSVIEAVRDVLPRHVPLSVRISTVDGVNYGWQLADSIVFSKKMKALGVDIVDCSSGGIQGSATAGNSSREVKRGRGFQVPFAQAVKSEAEIPTIAVGLIIDPEQAEKVLIDNKADLIAIGREALYNPNWPLHARLTLGVDPDYNFWPKQYGWWLKRRSEYI